MSQTVKPVPEGMSTVTPHLVCAGAARAIEFYKQAFRAEEKVRLAGPDGKLMHACLQIGDSAVMLVDENEKCGMRGPAALGGSPVTIHLAVANADMVFSEAVAAGAKVIMPVADMFWGDRYGVLQDPFGHQWSVATHIRDLTPDQLHAAAAEACKQHPQ